MVKNRDVGVKIRFLEVLVALPQQRGSTTTNPAVLSTLIIPTSQPCRASFPPKLWHDRRSNAVRHSRLNLRPIFTLNASTFQATVRFGRLSQLHSAAHFVLAEWATVNSRTSTRLLRRMLLGIHIMVLIPRPSRRRAWLRSQRCRSLRVR